MILLAVALFLAVAESLECGAAERGSAAFPLAGKSFQLSWQHACANASTSFSFTAANNGWVAFALCDRDPAPDQEAMVGCEYFMFNADLKWRNGGNNSFNGEPKPLDVDMMRDVNVSHVNGVYTASFVRAWAPVDAVHVSLTPAAGLRAMASFGPTGFFGVQHFGPARVQLGERLFLFGRSDNATAAPSTLMSSSGTTTATTTTTTTSGGAMRLAPTALLLLLLLLCTVAVLRI